MFRYILLIVLFVIAIKQVQVAAQSTFPAHAVDPSLLHIQWDTTTFRYVANGGYARMVALEDGTLITVYAAVNGNTEIVKSTGNGNSWSQPIIVAAKQNNVRMDAPDMLLLNDGALLVCYNPRPSSKNTDTTKHFGIRIVKSYDKGLTWKEDQLLYEAGTLFKDGCWEPAALQLPDGELQLFFSDEGVYTNSDEQNISMFRSSDNGKTWSKKPEIVSFRKGSRDGMPAPVYLKATDEILFSIEDNGFNNFKPYIIRTALKDNWHKTVTAESRNRSYALKDSLDKNIYAGAPYLRVLPNGNTVLSYQSTEFRNSKHDVNNAEMVVVIGDSTGRNFTNATKPFNLPADATGLWNSITVLKDGTVVALTSTKAFNGKYSVYMIKGKINYSPL